MECPKCGWVRSSKAWWPCQWSRKEVECCGFHQCKVCAGKMAHENTWHWKPGMQTTQSHQRSDHKCKRPLPTHEGTDIPFQALQLQELASNCNSCALGGFVMLWMELPRNQKKQLSYNGAVESRVGDPCHYTCPDELVRYFDPGNYIYSAALSIMAPNLEIETNWNAETRGDICESIMGFGYLSRTKRISCSCRSRKVSQQMSTIIDTFSWLTYHLYAATGALFPNWVKWIKETAAWRKCQTVDDASHQNLQVICAELAPSVPPRQKIGGVLHNMA